MCNSLKVGKLEIFLLDFDKFQYVPLIVYLDSLLFMLELFVFVNSRHFCHNEDVQYNRSSGLKILVYRQYWQKNMHSTLDIGPRPAGKDLNVPQQ